MSSSSKESSVSVGFGGLLTLLFITLKLLGLIDWSWWWVLLPAWGTALLAAIVITVYIIIAVIRYRE